MQCVIWSQGSDISASTMTKQAVIINAKRR
jgi:hypothetical protein